jgi:hypothetical protein
MIHQQQYAITPFVGAVVAVVVAVAVVIENKQSPVDV